MKKTKEEKHILKLLKMFEKMNLESISTKEIEDYEQTLNQEN